MDCIISTTINLGQKKYIAQIRKKKKTLRKTRTTKNKTPSDIKTNEPQINQTKDIILCTF